MLYSNKLYSYVNKGVLKEGHSVLPQSIYPPSQIFISNCLTFSKPLLYLVSVDKKMVDHIRMIFMQLFKQDLRQDFTVFEF